MNTNNHKLDELLRAAREETPVVSFLESAEQVARLADAEVRRRRKRGFAWLLDKAFAFPRQIQNSIFSVARLVTLRRSSMFFPSSAVLPGVSTSILPFVLRPSSVRFALGAVFITTLLTAFPSLIHEGMLPYHYSEVNRLKVTNNTVAGATIPPHSGFAAEAALRNRNGSKDTKSSLLARVQMPVQEKENAADNNSAQESLDPNTTLFVPLSTALSSVSSPATSTTSHNTSSPNGAPIFAVATPSPKETPFQQLTAQETPQEQEQGFWKRLSIEARVATRTEIASQTATNENIAFNTRQQFASETASPLQNIALGAMYALDEHHSIGIEGGNEPFLSAIRSTPGFGTPSTSDTDRSTTLTPSIRPPGLTADTSSVVDINSEKGRIAAETRNRIWFGAAYQYNFTNINALGGIQPLARLTLGGGEIGVIGRAIVGACFLPQNQVSVLLAGEGAGIAHPGAITASGAWEFTPRLGMTLGLSVKF